MPLTLEERERRAYIEGRTEEAAMLQDAMDAQHAADDELRHEVDFLKGEQRGLEAENTRLQEDLEAAETKIENLRQRVQQALVTADA